MTPHSIPVLELQGGSYKINVDNFNSVLNQAQDLPLAILSINGKSREGKSYALNYFIRYLENPGDPHWFKKDLGEREAFAWRSGSNRVTAGINIWSKPFLTKLHGKDVAVILLDSQGIYDEYTTKQENAAIFALSSLLSSGMIYNVKNKVQDDVLQNVEYHSSYTKSLSSSSASAQNQEGNQVKPSFWFLVRDFEFLQEFDFGFHDQNTQPVLSTEGMGNYFKRIFDITPQMPEENQGIRREILNCYQENVGVFTMPHPGRAFLQNSAQNPPKENFQKYLKEFVEHVMNHLPTKKIGQEEVTGKRFKAYVENWADFWKHGTFPPASTINELTAMLQGNQAISLAFENFTKSLQTFLSSTSAGVDDTVFSQKFEGYFEEAKEIYEGASSLANSELNAKNLEKLDKMCRDHFHNYSKKENSWARERKELNEKINNEFKTAAINGFSSLPAKALEITANAAVNYFLKDRKDGTHTKPTKAVEEDVPAKVATASASNAAPAQVPTEGPSNTAQGSSSIVTDRRSIKVGTAPSGPELLINVGLPIFSHFVNGGEIPGLDSSMGQFLAAEVINAIGTATISAMRDSSSKK